MREKEQTQFDMIVMNHGHDQICQQIGENYVRHRIRLGTTFNSIIVIIVIIHYV